MMVVIYFVQEEGWDLGRTLILVPIWLPYGVIVKHCE